MWWSALSEQEQIEIDAKVRLLQERGPTLPRPHSDVITQSKHPNMKELRGKVDIAGGAARHLRVLYAFDPNRTALLLIGGDKSGNPGWYDQFVPLADRLLDQHLQAIEHEASEKEHRERKRQRSAEHGKKLQRPKK